MEENPVAASAKAISEMGMFPVVEISEEEIERILDRLFGPEEKDDDTEPVPVPES